ncbi:MAG: ABC transporter ATP-binding protein/permease [Ezakiella sp.]|nr:ABC transporter ATP-binding protein/permease [Ezakiella sp.]MDD7471635.1 ABC transporter ATP-binding protein [Bacillota bacterium]MDY3923419.1 ABC transporter ATP-binding protein [Ezakiella sp.]
MKFLKTVSKYMKPYKKNYIFGVLWLMLIDTLVIYVPQILRNFSNDYQNGILTSERALKYAILTILAGVIMGVGRYFWRVYLFGSSRKIEYDIRKQLFQHWLTMDNEFYNHNKIGDLMAYATNDINSLRSFLGDGIMMSVDSTFMLGFTIVMMIQTVGLKITALSLIPIPITAFVVVAVRNIFYKMFKARQESYAGLSDATTESFSGISVIKAFVEEKEAKKRFDKANRNYWEKDMDVVKYQTFFFPFMVLLSGISYLLVIYFGARFVINGTISLGDFIAQYTYIGIIMWPARGLGIIIGIIQQASAGLYRIEDMLNLQPTIKDIDNPIRLPKDTTSIEFKNVYFKYPGENKYAIENLSFKLENNKSLAFVGKTGSSKSTVIKLLFREYLPTSGEILIDGHPISEIRINDLSEKTGYVPQDNFLFSESLKENIAFSYEDRYEIDDVYDAAKKSGVYNDIMDFKDDFDTVIGERGVTLSGGQKQRVAIARALVKEPKLLILDDSLSAVDTNTEKNILDALKKINTTSIIIAHRISTIKNCDQIIFLENGAIKEQGTHEQLVNLNGEYNKMYQNQLLENELEEGF